MKNILYMGLDVDDKAFHGAGICEESGKTMEFSCRPSFQALLRKLKIFQQKGFELRTCYEATYIGYSLHRLLKKEGIKNSIIAPSMIPKIPGKCVKTDRLDSKKLAFYLSKGFLSEISVPTEQDEKVRDIIRSRSFLVYQRTALKRHMLSLSRRYGLNYKGETGGKSHWTEKHRLWLEKRTKDLGEEVRRNIVLLLHQYERINEVVKEYEERIEAFSERPEYKRRKEVLCCFRGMDTLFAMILITEIGDIRRFPHPGKLSSYAGFDVREYSSGGKERKYGISKLGNKQIRTVVVEACQQLNYNYRISRRLKAAREGMPEEVVQIADKCMRRLRKKWFQLYHGGKPINKIKVACAREYLCFVWEALRTVN